MGPEILGLEGKVALVTGEGDAVGHIGKGCASCWPVLPVTFSWWTVLQPGKPYDPATYQQASLDFQCGI